MSNAKNVVLAFMALGIVVMLGASFMQRINNPDLVMQARGSAPMQAESMSANDTPMSPQVGELMQAIQENPNDIPTIFRLTESLIESAEWSAAENFIHRALELEPQNAQAHYLHGIILYNSGKHDEAYTAFESVVKIKEDASARYSLGILQVYHFEDLNKGIEQFEIGLSNPNIHDELKNAIQAELDKAKAAKSN